MARPVMGRVILELPKEVKDKLTIMAKSKGLLLSPYIRMLLIEYLERGE
jgi:hypothetical protein